MRRTNLAVNRNENRSSDQIAHPWEGGDVIPPPLVCACMIKLFDVGVSATKGYLPTPDDDILGILSNYAFSVL